MRGRQWRSNHRRDGGHEDTEAEAGVMQVPPQAERGRSRSCWGLQIESGP